MPTSAPSRHARAQLAQRTAAANKNPDDPVLAAEVEERRREFRFLSAQDYIKQLVDSAPPLTAEQRDRLALMLRGSAA